MSKYTVRDRQTRPLTGIVEDEAQPVRVATWPEPCKDLFDAWVIEGDKEKAYEIAKKHFPKLAHMYKPD